MICPKCMVQMHQKTDAIPSPFPHPLHGGVETIPMPIGSGIAVENEYITWELKECPACDRLTVEFYGAYLVQNVEQAKALVKTLIE